MRFLALVCVFLIAGCSHTSVRFDSGGGVTSTRAGVSIGYSGNGSAAAWALIGVGLIAAEYGGSRAARKRGLEPERAGERELDAARQVNEVDCTRPSLDAIASPIQGVVPKPTAYHVSRKPEGATTALI
ncbi:MAG: hypothetical protein ACREVD_07890 [Burkholderiales bacterium]